MLHRIHGTAVGQLANLAGKATVAEQIPAHIVAVTGEDQQVEPSVIRKGNLGQVEFAGVDNGTKLRDKIL